MRELNLALAHISEGTAYSWDLTTLISLGIPVSHQFRQKLLSGATTQEDAAQLRKQVSMLLKASAHETGEFEELAEIFT